MTVKNKTIDLKINLSSDDKQIHLSKYPNNNYYSLWFAVSDDNALCEVELKKIDLLKLVNLISEFIQLDMELENNTD